MLRPVILFLLFAPFTIATAQPPLPEMGKRWVLNPDYSDEFNGTSLDLSKWYDHHPTWKGRPPGLFMPSQVRVADGLMTIRGEKMEKDTLVDGRLFNIKGGAVVSRKRTAWFGYYECRLKAAKTTMSTTFWFSSRDRFPGPEDCDDDYSMEWDIQECIGRTGDFDGSWFASGMHSNAHYWYSDCEGKRHDYRSPEVRFEDDKLASEDFNVYGGWWKDKSTALYYFNGSNPKSQHFYDTITKKPFDRPMGMNLVCETYPFPWIELPNDEELADPEKNICYYDWVRAYTLVDVNDQAGGDGFSFYGENIKLVSGAVVDVEKESCTIPYSYMAGVDREIHFRAVHAGSGVKLGDLLLPAYAGYGHSQCKLELDDSYVPGEEILISVYLSAADSEDQTVISSDRFSLLD